jgi:hypothetical protein
VLQPDDVDNTKNDNLLAPLSTKVSTRKLVRLQETATMKISSLPLLLIVTLVGTTSTRAFPVGGTTIIKRQQPHPFMSMALGDFTVELEKPLGMILEERKAGGGSGGVRVKELVPDGAAASTKMVPGDVLLQIDQTDVSSSDFDSVMDLLISAQKTVTMTLGDGLGQLNMPKNVVKTLKTPEDAFFVDAVVREAVREIRRKGRRLGDLLQVEVIIGVGVKEQEGKRRAMVRFFAIFSTDGVSTYSCNVSATGVRAQDDDDNYDDSNIEIVSLSCAKDEGLGQTYDLIQESA